MPLRSGAKADWAPVCLSVVTAVQPQPPGAQVATADANWPSPLSKPSVTGVSSTHGVAVAVAGAVAVGGVPVAVGVAVGAPPLRLAALTDRLYRGQPVPGETSWT